MSEFVSEINKIYIDSPLQVKNVNMTTLLFSDGLLSPKANYTITENMLFLKNQAETSLNLFQFVDSSNYYEFLVNLREKYTIISGTDRYGNELKKLSDTLLVFVNGYKLSSSEYVLNEQENTITIKSSYTEKNISTVIIYTSNDAVYEGNVEDDFSWNSEYNQFLLKDYSVDRYVFFKNGELLPPNKIQKVGNYVRLNTVIKHDVDFVEYYRMSKDCYALSFTPSFGYLTYGPKDDRGMTIQNLYNCMIVFDNIVRLTVDDVRPGFFVHETNGNGCVMMVDDDFEGCSVKCIVITPFDKTSLSSSEYFLTVPDAPSIMKYVSQYDLNGTLFKELLTSFQKVLLNETYDAIQRLKNVRNINKVDSSNISALINFLGLNINVTNLTLEKKHNLVEELRTFYDTVGTRASYNFYNAFREDGKILNIEQLFTPIKSTGVVREPDTFFPKKWGKLLSVEQTFSQNKTRDDYIYTWSLHFEKGILPVTIRRDSLTPKFETGSFQYINDEEVNSTVYDLNNKTWFNAIATDEPDYMCWKYKSNDLLYEVHLPYAKKLEDVWWRWEAKNTISSTVLYKSYQYIDNNFDIPSEYGAFQYSYSTSTPNEDRSDHIYILSLHFENGTLPIKVYHNDWGFTLDLSYFTNDTNSEINSMVYTNNQWINSIAKNESQCMIWSDQYGTKKRALDYFTAAVIGWNDGYNTVDSVYDVGGQWTPVLTCSVQNNVMTIYKWGTPIGTLRLQATPPENQKIYITNETAGASVYNTSLDEIGTLTSISANSCVYNGFTYNRTSTENDIERQNISEETFYKYTHGEAIEGGVCYDDTGESNPQNYTNPTEETFNLNGLTYTVIEKAGSSEELDGLTSVHTNRFSFTINSGILIAKDTETGKAIGSWTFYDSSSESGDKSNESALRRYVDFKTAEELGAIYKQKYITETIDFGQVSELAKDGGINLANTPKYEGVLKYQNYPPVLKGIIDRYHPTDNYPMLFEDKLTLSITSNSVTRYANISEDSNYECEIDEETGEIILVRYIGSSSNVRVPENITYETRKVVDISVVPSNLRVDLYDSNGKKLRTYGYDENTNRFTFLIDDDDEYSYKILDKNKNVLLSTQLEDGDKTITSVVPLVNDYTSSPRQGPNKATIDCGYITDTPVDFYDFGSVAEQLRGHWVSWYEWDNRGNWYPTNHVDVSVEIPLNMDYETFMNIFKDTFYQMASAVLYIHQITQIYTFGDPNNNGLTEIQPMSLLTTQVYKTEEQCFTNDHEFLPYKKAISNKPLKLKSYMFKNPRYEFVESHSDNVTGTSVNLKEFFPEEWGKLNEVKQTVALNETNDDYLFTWSLHFDNGTLPVVVDKNALVPNWNLTLFTSDTNPELNGCCYKQGEWINTVASDEGDYMLWKASNGSAIRSLNYISADNMNWYVYNNKITVHSHKFNFVITDDLLIIGDVETTKNESLKVSVDLYRNFGRDEYLYNTTGEEKDIEWIETLTGYFPCKQLNYTDWTSEQESVNVQTIDEKTSDASWEVIDTLPVFNITCIPNVDRTDWIYSLVINYDNREEGYIVSKDLQTVTKIIESTPIKDLQTVIDGKIEYVRPNSLFYEKGNWYLSYVTLDKEFSVYEWKLATLNDTNPEDQHENLKAGIAHYTLAEASAINWNNGKINEVVIDYKIDVNSNNQASIWIDQDDVLYSKINYTFDINNSPYTNQYSYTHNNVTWSCDLKKYNVYNNVQLESETKKNCTTLLLPTNIVYTDNNTGLKYEFGETIYQFSKVQAELEKIDEEKTEEGEKIYYEYTNKLSSTIDNSSFSFNTKGTLVSSEEIILRDVDYIVIRYKWTTGSDLDSHTRITNSSNTNISNYAVGWYASGSYIPIDNPNEQTNLMNWAGDNQGTGQESILINVSNMKEIYTSDLPNTVNIELRCGWWGSIGDDVYIQIDGYKNGTMHPSGFEYVNIGGELKYSIEEKLLNVNYSTRCQSKIGGIPPEDCPVHVVATLSYNQTTKNVILNITPKQDS